MSKVVFWSPVQGSVESSYYTSAVSMMISLEYRLRLLVGHTGTLGSSIEEALTLKDSLYDSSLISFRDIGIDALARLWMSLKLSKDNIADYMYSLLPERLDLLIGGGEELSSSILDRTHLTQAILHAAQQYYDLVMIDSSPNNNVDTTVFNEADLVIACLPQNMRVLESFFNKISWPEALNGKSYMVVISNYDAESHCNLPNIKRRFGYKGDMFGIPYNTQFMDAWNDRELVSFFKRNYRIDRKRDSISNYICSLRNLSKGLIDTLGMQVTLRQLEKGA